MMKTSNRYTQSSRIIFQVNNNTHCLCAVVHPIPGPPSYCGNSHSRSRLLFKQWTKQRRMRSFTNALLPESIQGNGSSLFGFAHISFRAAAFPFVDLFFSPFKRRLCPSPYPVLTTLFLLYAKRSSRLIRLRWVGLSREIRTASCHRETVLRRHGLMIRGSTTQSSMKAERMKRIQILAGQSLVDR